MTCFGMSAGEIGQIAQLLAQLPLPILVILLVVSDRRLMGILPMDDFRAPPIGALLYEVRAQVRPTESDVYSLPAFP